VFADEFVSGAVQLPGQAAEVAAAHAGGLGRATALRP